MAVALWRAARKVVVAVIGTTVLAFGVALIVLPGPAVVVIPLGLAILGTEFLWARRLLQRLRHGADRVQRQAVRCPRGRERQPSPTSKNEGSMTRSKRQ